jgi:hypothetical protein
MDLVAGDAREILLAIGVEDWSGLRDPRRFEAYVSLGGGMDPGWLDLFAQAVRETTGRREPGSFSDAASTLETRMAAMSERSVERVDRHWVEAIAVLPDDLLDRAAGRWIDLIDREECDVDTGDKPMLRELAGELVSFCRGAEHAEDVLFVWSI